MYDFYNPHSKVISDTEKIDFYITPEYGYYKAASPYKLDVVYTSTLKGDIFPVNKIYLRPIGGGADIPLQQGNVVSFTASKVGYKSSLREHEKDPDVFVDKHSFDVLDLEHKEYSLVIETPDGDMITFPLEPFTRQAVSSLH